MEMDQQQEEVQQKEQLNEDDSFKNVEVLRKGSNPYF
jgi:hypothetical protein